MALKPLIWRDYRGDVGVEEVEKFLPLVVDSEDEVSFSFHPFINTFSPDRTLPNGR
jgi:hypothetical protein